MTLGQGSVALLFVVYIFAARLLGDVAFGEFSLGLAIAAVLFILPSWGSGRYSSIIAARDPDRTEEILATYLGLTLPLAVVCIPLVGAVSFLITGNSTVVAVAVILGVDELVREIGNVLRLLFRVHDQYPLEALTWFTERGGIIVAASAALLVAPHPVVLAAAFAGGRALGAVVTAAYFRRRVARIRIRFDPQALGELFRAGTPLALRRGIGMVTFRVDMLFLGALRPTREAGWYASIYTIMEGAIMFPQAVTGAFGPTLSASHAEGRRDVIQRLYGRGLKYLVLIGLALAAGLALLAEPFIQLVYGSEYLPAVPGLMILALAVPFVFVRSLTTEVLDDIDLRGASVRIFGLALLLNVVLNIVLVPRYGFLGAAASTVATELCLAAMMITALARAGYRPGLVRHLRGPVLAILPTAGVLLLLRDAPLLAVPAAGALYLLALTVFGTWDDKDLDLFRTLLARVRGNREA